jgi:hypothetical protein
LSPPPLHHVRETWRAAILTLPSPAVTVGECLGEARANWYRAPRNGSPATTTKATPTATAFPESPDWSCGAGIGYRCPGTNCCSQYGWCGSTSEYCGAGCQKSYGKCN